MHTTRSSRFFDHRPLLRCLSGMALLAAASVTPAQQTVDAADDEHSAPRYAVEIILFSYGNEVSAGGEIFPPDEPVLPEDFGFEDRFEAPGADGEVRAIPEFGDRQPAEQEAADIELEEIVVPANIELTVTPRRELGLKSEYDKLVELDAYRPVLWAGWSQSTFEQDITPEIRLRRLGNAPLTYDGTLKLYLSRFLHLVVDLSMAAPGSASPAPGYSDARSRYDYGDPRGPATGGVYYRINEDRIVKNGDIRYFDHPKFGLLAKVTRIETPEPGPDDNTNGAAQPAAGNN